MLIQYEHIKNDPGSSLRLLHQQVSPARYIWQYHHHPEVELACIIDGSGIRHVGSHMSRYDQGDLILLGSNLPHSGFGLNASNPHEEVIIQVLPHVLTQAIENYIELRPCASLLEKAKYGISFSGETFQKVRVEMLEFTKQPKEQRVFSLYKILTILAKSEEFVLLNDNIVASNKLNYTRKRLKDIFNYIELKYADKIDIKDISNIVGLTVPSFSSYFKRSTSMTFTDFVNQYRIQRACYLLKQGKSVTETSYLCGYNSISYFNRIFKKIMEISPSKYIQLYQNESKVRT